VTAKGAPATAITLGNIGDLIKEASAKVGENIQVRRFVRFQMGEE